MHILLNTYSWRIFNEHLALAPAVPVLLSFLMSYTQTFHNAHNLLYPISYIALHMALDPRVYCCARCTWNCTTTGRILLVRCCIFSSYMDTDAITLHMSPTFIWCRHQQIQRHLFWDIGYLPEQRYRATAREVGGCVNPDWLGLQKMPLGAPTCRAPITHIIIFTYCNDLISSAA